MLGGESSAGMLAGQQTPTTTTTSYQGVFPKFDISVDDFATICLRIYKVMQSFRDLSFDLSRAKELLVQTASVPHYTPYSFLRLLVSKKDKKKHK